MDLLLTEHSPSSVNNKHYCCFLHPSFLMQYFGCPPYFLSHSTLYFSAHLQQIL
uniref:Uncharacterized protein n=1 Tax=Octopus bimaculoides TaxID=37653 RepID=A0A0L8I3F4_OCTBM